MSTFACVPPYLKELRTISRLILLCFVVLGLIAVSAPAASAATCNIRGKERKLGATYVTKVTATGVSCSSALTLVKAYHACRKRNGGADGRCPRVSGYRCRESRRISSPTQYDTTATCTNGSRKVVQRYTQNT